MVVPSSEWTLAQSGSRLLEWETSAKSLLRLLAPLVAVFFHSRLCIKERPRDAIPQYHFKQILMFGTLPTIGPMKLPLSVTSKKNPYSLPCEDQSRAWFRGGFGDFDVFRGHTSEAEKALLNTNNIISVMVPLNCTQPMDLSVNKPFKDHLRSQFTVWYSDQVTKELSSGKEPEVKWLICAYDYIRVLPRPF